MYPGWRRSWRSPAASGGTAKDTGLRQQAAEDVRQEIKDDLHRAAGAPVPFCALRIGGQGMVEDGRAVPRIILELSGRPALGRSPLAGSPGHGWSVTADPGPGQGPAWPVEPGACPGRIGAAACIT